MGTLGWVVVMLPAGLFTSCLATYLRMGTLVSYLDTAQQTWVEQRPKRDWTTNRASLGRGPVYPESRRLKGDTGV